MGSGSKSPKKLNTLGIGDYKAFKFLKDISKRYVFGRNLG
jgi:hypothetical protein